MTAYMRVAILWPWLLIVAMVANVALRLIFDQRVNLVVAALVVVASTPIAVLVAWVCARAYPVRVHAEGLGGVNLWGLRVTIPWSEAGSSRPSSLLGLPFLLVGPRPFTSCLWLPLFLAKPEEFGSALARFAGPEHDIVRAFRKWHRFAT